MKTPLYLLLLLVVGCTKESPVPEELKSLTGKWRMMAYERFQKGQIVWIDVSKDTPSYTTFRADGVVLDGNGLGVCCSPVSLKINGKLFKVEPKEAIPANPGCAVLSCAFCDYWDIVLQTDSLVLIHCVSNEKFRYVRVP